MRGSCLGNFDLLSALCRYSGGRSRPAAAANTYVVLALAARRRCCGSGGAGFEPKEVVGKKEKDEFVPDGGQLFFDKVHYHGQCIDLVGEGDHESPAGGVGDVRLHIEILVHVDEREWEVRWGCFFLIACSRRWTVQDVVPNLSRRWMGVP